MIMNTWVDREVPRMIAHFQQLKGTSQSMYTESMWQYADMANSGDGGPTNWDVNGESTSTLRRDYYEGYPDSFFLVILSSLGELWRLND